MVVAKARAAGRLAFVALATTGSSGAFSPNPLQVVVPPSTSIGNARSFVTQAQTAARIPGALSPAPGLFGLGGGESSNAPPPRGGAPALSKARKAVESNAVFKARTTQVRRMDSSYSITTASCS